MATLQLATRAYQQSFDSRPYTTLAITNGSLSAVGDCVAQLAQILVSGYDFYFAGSTSAGYLSVYPFLINLGRKAC